MVVFPAFEETDGDQAVTTAVAYSLDRMALSIFQQGMPQHPARQMD